VAGAGTVVKGCVIHPWLGCNKIELTRIIFIYTTIILFVPLSISNKYFYTGKPVYQCTVTGTCILSHHYVFPMCREIVMPSIYIGYCESETLPLFYFCVARLSLATILNWMLFVLAKYHIISYIVIFHTVFKICVPPSFATSLAFVINFSITIKGSALHHPWNSNHKNFPGTL